MVNKLDFKWRSIEQGYKKHFVCKLYTANLKSSKSTTVYREKHLCGMEVFRIVFAYKNKYAHTKKHAIQGLYT